MMLRQLYMVLCTKNNKGFSLIELMVVVAIIGILSAVAVPQFQKFQRKAKQSEARASLSGLYLAEKVFLAEHGTYYTALPAIGYEPEGVIKYRMGFGTAAAVPSPPGFTGGYMAANSTIRDSVMLCNYTFPVGYGKNCMADVSYTGPGVPLAAWTAVSGASFLAGARSNIGGASIDTWTIDHRKELINTVNGAL